MYLLCCVTAILISFELLTLFFAMNILSSLRALVAGEGKWSKSQKNAIIHLQEYISLNDEKYYDLFLEDLKIPTANYKARLELEKKHVNYNDVAVFFLEGGSHIQDIKPTIMLLTVFYNNRFLTKAINDWKVADVLLADIINYAQIIKKQFTTNKLYTKDIQDLMLKVSNLNNQLTEVEDSFSQTLGEASRWLEKTLILLMATFVLLIETTIFYLVYKFCNQFTEGIKKLNEAMNHIGKGNLNIQLQVTHHDEIGQMNASLNKMTDNLIKQINKTELAEHANQTKNLFLANISHEIRSPLNSILGFTEILRDPQLSETERNYFLDIISRTGITLNNIVSDLLDLSKIEADHLSIEKNPFSLKQLLDDLYQSLSLKCQEKGIELKFIKKGNFSDYIYSDANRLKQILNNLIGNSIKFTDKGYIKVTYESKNNFLNFEIEDSGIGISEEQLEKLFIPFSQGNHSIHKKYGGTGLGLVISKKLANLLGGDIVILNSVVNQGSRFLVTIDYNKTQSTQEDSNYLHSDTDKNVNALQGAKILVADDTIENQILIKMFLLKSGAEITNASNGEEALIETTKTPFDIILMDMQMPLIDGYEATKQLRLKGFNNPIVAMTGYSMKEDKEKCLQSGCNFYLSKPFSKQALTNTLTEAMISLKLSLKDNSCSDISR